MTYRRSPAVDETSVGERLVLYHRVSGSAVVLNPAASLLWKALADAADPAALADALQKRFPFVDHSRVKADVKSCLDDFASHQLVSAKSHSESPAS